MPLYSFRCVNCGIFDAFYTMQTCPNSLLCPNCSRLCAKIITSVQLSCGNSLAIRLEDFTRSTADTPQIVQGSLPVDNTMLPKAGMHCHKKQVSISTNPLHYTLPKP